MALKLKKKTEEHVKVTAKPKAKPKATVLENVPSSVEDFLALPENVQAMALEAMINKRGHNMAEEVTLKKKLAEISKQKKEIETILRALPQLEDLDFDETVDLETEEFLATIGKMGTSRYVDEDQKLVLREMLGEENFIKLANFKLTDLDKYLTGVQKQQVISAENSERSITIKAKT